MMKSFLDEKLEQLRHSMIQTGALCERIIAAASNAVLSADVNASGDVRELEQQIDQREKDTEDMCLKLLLRMQPVARDLRFISSSLKMITDMQRIGDQCGEIAAMAGYVSLENIKSCAYISEMAQAAQKMVTKSIDAFVRCDVDTARGVEEDDDYIDGRFEAVKKYLINEIHRDKQAGEDIIDLLMIAKYYERIGDHAVNIARWVTFSVTGVHEGEI